MSHLTEWQCDPGAYFASWTYLCAVGLYAAWLYVCVVGWVVIKAAGWYEAAPECHHGQWRPEMARRPPPPDHRQNISPHASSPHRDMTHRHQNDERQAILAFMKAMYSVSTNKYFLKPSVGKYSHQKHNSCLKLIAHALECQPTVSTSGTIKIFRQMPRCPWSAMPICLWRAIPPSVISRIPMYTLVYQCIPMYTLLYPAYLTIIDLNASKDIAGTHCLCGCGC